eukprot:scaffold2003_cov119-Isochrysis_galbana.AAC.1
MGGRAGEEAAGVGRTCELANGRSQGDRATRPRMGGAPQGAGKARIRRKGRSGDGSCPRAGPYPAQMGDRGMTAPRVLWIEVRVVLSRDRRRRRRRRRRESLRVAQIGWWRPRRRRRRSVGRCAATVESTVAVAACSSRVAGTPASSVESSRRSRRNGEHRPIIERPVLSSLPFTDA